jgi:hypothetical protein
MIDPFCQSGTRKNGKARTENTEALRGCNRGALRFRGDRGMCYNRKAVIQDGKQEKAPAGTRGTAVTESPEGKMTVGKSAAELQEDPSQYCPVCSQRLESRRCKLVCSVCGYYMSCADYY